MLFGSVKTVIRVEGMMCEHCVMHVRDALSKLPGVKSVEISLQDKTATIKSKKPLANDRLKALIEEAGYKYEGIASFSGKGSVTVK